MPKLSHCGQFYDAREWHKLLCEEDWIGQFKHQVVLIGKCPQCKQETRGWYGIDHNDQENQQVQAIKPKKFEYWDRRIKIYTLVSSKGCLAVKIQKYWDGIPLKAMRLQEV